jgi:hypothetical protein
VPELAGGEDDVQPLSDQERGKAVPKGVEREPSAPAFPQPRPPKRRPEALADVAVVQPAAARVAEDDRPRTLEWGGEPTLAQEVTTDGASTTLRRAAAVL